MKKLFCFPALELFHCLPLWKTVLFVSSRAFLLSTPTFLLSTPVENSEATWKKATKCNKGHFGQSLPIYYLDDLLSGWSTSYKWYYALGLNCYNNRLLVRQLDHFYAIIKIKNNWQHCHPSTISHEFQFQVFFFCTANMYIY